MDGHQFSAATEKRPGLVVTDHDQSKSMSFEGIFNPVCHPMTFLRIILRCSKQNNAQNDGIRMLELKSGCSCASNGDLDLH